MVASYVRERNSIFLRWLENVERLRRIEHCQVVSSVAELEQALDALLKALSLAWNASSS